MRKQLKILIFLSVDKSRCLLRNFKYRFKNLLSKKFINDTIILQFGGIFSSVIFFLGSVILARVLGVDLYGQYVLIFAFISLINLFTNWGEQGVALTIAPEAYAKKDYNRFKEVLQYTFFITIISTLIINLVAFLFAPQLTEILYHNAQIGNFARVVMVMSTLQIFYLFFTVILQIIREVKYLAIIEALNKFFHVGISVLLVVFGYGLWGIVYGKLIVAVMFFLFTIYAYLFLARRNSLIPKIRELMVGFRYQIVKKFFKFSVGISLDKNIGSLFGILPLLLLGFYGATEEVSFFKIGYSYISLPFMLFGPIAKLLSVQLPQSKAYGRDILKRDFWRVTIFSGLINLVLVVVFLIMAAPLVRIFYGAEFLGSIPVIYLLSIVFILSGFNIGVGAIIKTIRKVRYTIIVNTITIIVQLLSFYWLLDFGVSTIMAVILSMIIITVFNMLLVYPLIIKNLRSTNSSVT